MCLGGGGVPIYADGWLSCVTRGSGGERLWGEHPAFCVAIPAEAQVFAQVSTAL